MNSIKLISAKCYNSKSLLSKVVFSHVSKYVTTRFHSNSITIITFPKQLKLSNNHHINCQSKHFCSTNHDDHSITVEELKDLIAKNKDSLIIDVREPDEIEVNGKIQGALNIPLNELEFALHLSDDRFENKYGREKPSHNGENVVFSCRSGVRSLRAVTYAKTIGMVSAKSLTGGHVAWLASNPTS